MVSLKFPFSFSQSPNPATNNASFRSFATVCSAAVVAGAGISAGIAISQKNNSNKKDTDKPMWITNAFSYLVSNNFSPMWGSLSLSDSSAPVTESRTGVSFPAIVKDSQRLLSVGVRRKAILGLKNIDVYAFGVYANDGDVKKFLSEKYGTISVSDLKEKEEFKEDLMSSDINMTIRLQIVYGRLSIRSVRNAFEESVGSRLRKFGGSVDKDLLQSFTSQFKDEYKIPKGSIIDLSREQGHTLRTSIDGKEVGNIQSVLLCRSILDLYIGDEPFDPKAKEAFEHNLVSLLQK